MSICMATKGIIADQVYYPVPSMEIEIEIEAATLVEVALEAAEITVEVD